MATTNYATSSANAPSTKPLGDTESQIAQLRSDLASIAESVRDSAGAQLSNAKDVASDSLNDIEKRVRRDPLMAVGIAAGVGLLLGAMLSR